MNESNDILRVQGINSNGFGMIPKLVMQDERLSIQAKAIYSYFCSYAGAGKTAFPKRNKIIADLKISKDSYYKHFNLLKETGYIKVAQEKDKQGYFARNIYTLIDNVPCPKKADTAKNDCKPCPNLPDTDLPDTEKQDINKNNSIKSNSIKNNSLSRQEPTDGQSDLQTILSLIHENIGYEDLKLTHAADMKLVDEFVNIILDALLSQSETVRINGENKPRELVKSSLMKLTYADMEHVLHQFKEHGERIKKKPQYILSMLYNSPMELNAHFTNWVQADWNAMQPGRKE